MVRRMSELIALQPLRHECKASGNCCFGWRVRLVGDDEVERITAFGIEFGVPDPVEDGALRFADGGCGFRDPVDHLCRIHKAHGSAAKPKTCQQFPLRVTATEDGVRVGVDPGCTSTWQTWKDGPILPSEPLVPPAERIFDPQAKAAEDDLVSLTQEPEMTFAHYLGFIAGAPEAAPELPEGFGARVAQRLKAMRLMRFLDHPAIGPGMSEPLRHVARYIDLGIPAERTARWAGTLADGMDDFVLDALRRQLFLRLGDPMLPPFGQALVFSAGVLACAWADPTPEVFAPALSTWARVMRMKAVWGQFIPRPETVRWLVTGQA